MVLSTRTTVLLIRALGDLLDTTELNLDELEDSTVEAIDRAYVALSIASNEGMVVVD